MILYKIKKFFKNLKKKFLKSKEIYFLSKGISNEENYNYFYWLTLIIFFFGGIFFILNFIIGKIILNIIFLFS